MMVHKHFWHKTVRIILLITSVPLLTHCGFAPVTDGPPAGGINFNTIPNAVPRPLSKSKYGNPRSYVVNGKTYYVLSTARGYHQRGIASWYGTKFHGQLTSTRERYNLYGMTAASPVLPLPCFVRVTNLNNGRQVIVKVNDRGPFADNRIMDLSYAAAAKLGMLKHGTAPVNVVAIVPGAPARTVNEPVASPRYLIDRLRTQRYKRNAHRIKTAGHFYLQVGAYADYANAKRMQKVFQNKTPANVLIVPTKMNGRSLYLLKIGPLVNKDAIARVEEAISATP